MWRCRNRLPEWQRSGTAAGRARWARHIGAISNDGLDNDLCGHGIGRRAIRLRRHRAVVHRNHRIPADRPVRRPRPPDLCLDRYAAFAASPSRAPRPLTGRRAPLGRTARTDGTGQGVMHWSDAGSNSRAMSSPRSPVGAGGPSIWITASNASFWTTRRAASGTTASLDARPIGTPRPISCARRSKRARRRWQDGRISAP